MYSNGLDLLGLAALLVELVVWLASVQTAEVFGMSPGPFAKRVVATYRVPLYTLSLVVIAGLGGPRLAPVIGVAVFVALPFAGASAAPTEELWPATGFGWRRYLTWTIPIIVGAYLPLLGPLILLIRRSS